MRRFLMIMAAFISLAACTKVGTAEQTFFVNTYYTYSDHPDYGKKIADNTYVALYKDNGNEIDVSVMDIINPQPYDTKGNKLELKYVSDTKNGINTFQNIPNGRYVILALYSPYTFVNFYTFKKINVENGYDGTTEQITFDCSKNNGYQNCEL